MGPLWSLPPLTTCRSDLEIVPSAVELLWGAALGFSLGDARCDRLLLMVSGFEGSDDLLDIAPSFDATEFLLGRDDGGTDPVGNHPSREGLMCLIRGLLVRLLIGGAENGVSFSGASGFCVG